MVGLAAQGCASTARGPDPIDPAATTLRVDNRSTLELTVYVMRGPQANRLGTVSGSSTTELRIPPNFLLDGTQMRFQVDPLGVIQRTTYEVLVTPGDRVDIVYPR